MVTAITNIMHTSPEWIFFGSNFPLLIVVLSKPITLKIVGQGNLGEIKITPHLTFFSLGLLLSALMLFWLPSVVKTHSIFSHWAIKSFLKKKWESVILLFLPGRTTSCPRPWRWKILENGMCHTFSKNCKLVIIHFFVCINWALIVSDLLHSLVCIFFCCGKKLTIA